MKKAMVIFLATMMLLVGCGTTKEEQISEATSTVEAKDYNESIEKHDKEYAYAVIDDVRQHLNLFEESMKEAGGIGFIYVADESKASKNEKVEKLMEEAKLMIRNSKEFTDTSAIESVTGMVVKTDNTTDKDGKPFYMGTSKDAAFVAASCNLEKGYVVINEDVFESTELTENEKRNMLIHELIHFIIGIPRMGNEYKSANFIEGVTEYYTIKICGGSASSYDFEVNCIQQLVAIFGEEKLFLAVENNEFENLMENYGEKYGEMILVLLDYTTLFYRNMDLDNLFECYNTLEHILCDTATKNDRMTEVWEYVPDKCRSDLLMWQVTD